MSNQSDSVKSRVKRSAILLLMLSTLLAAIGVSIGGVAMADTTPNPGPDINTRAVLAPATASATNGATPPATFSGAVEGTTLSIHVNGPSGQFFGINAARMCKGGLNVSNSSQMNTTSGNCVPAAFGASDDFFKQVSAAPSNTSVDTTFRVGQGTQSWTDSGGSHTVTCDVSNPCAVWLWESVDTAISSSGNIFHHYDINYAGAPGAPGVASTPSNQQLSIHVTAPANTGNSASPLSYTINLDNGGGSFTGSEATLGAGLTHNFTGLNNFTQYTVSATATSTAADGTTTFVGPAGTAGPNATTTPVPPPPTNVQGTPADGQVALTWTAPAGPAVSSYDVLACTGTPGSAGNACATPISGSPHNTGSAATGYTYTGLSNGTVYTFQVRGIYSGTPGSYSAPSGTITPQGKFITQTISVTRPAGDLVLTQVCGAHGSTTTGTAPTLGSAPGGSPDPLFSQYPYPVDANGVPNANYPTNCGVNLGVAHFNAAGGQFFEATGALNQVTVVDTRDQDPGFTVSGQMGSFSNGGPNPHDSFSGSELGWSPVKTSDSAAFTASDGTTYDQTVSAGPVVPPNSPNATGLSHGAVLATAPAQSCSGSPASCTGGLGTAVLDANLDLLIPVYANHGVYTGTLTISAV